MNTNLCFFRDLMLAEIEQRIPAAVRDLAQRAADQAAQALTLKLPVMVVWMDSTETDSPECSIARRNIAERRGQTNPMSSESALQNSPKSPHCPSLLYFSPRMNAFTCSNSRTAH